MLQAFSLRLRRILPLLLSFFPDFLRFTAFSSKLLECGFIMLAYDEVGFISCHINHPYISLDLVMLVTYPDSDQSDEETGPSISLKEVNPAPVVAVKEDLLKQVAVVVEDPKHRSSKTVNYNPKYDELYAPEHGPNHPHKGTKGIKNTASGYMEPVHVSDFHFDNQRKTFHTYGFAADPSEDAGGSNVVGDMEAYAEQNGATMSEMKPSQKRSSKRKRNKNDDPSDIDNFAGPWAKYENEESVAMPNEEDQQWLDEYHAQKTKVKKSMFPDKEEEEKPPMDEKSILHIKDPVDYQGRSFLHPPLDVGVNLKSEYPPERCFLPKKHVHTWQGHTKGIQVMRWFPQYGHMFLTAGMDGKVKLFEMYNERRCVRTYIGHTLGVRDVCFNNDGTRFLSASYDRWAKLWDTETGQCIARFTTKSVPYCVRFNPDPNKQHFFLAGQQNKKVVCVCFPLITCFAFVLFVLFFYILVGHSFKAYLSRI